MNTFLNSRKGMCFCVGVLSIFILAVLTIITKVPVESSITAISMMTMAHTGGQTLSDIKGKKDDIKP